MDQENIAPVRHGTASSVGGTVGGAIGGGLKSGMKALLIATVIGAAIGGLWGIGVLGAIGSLFGATGGGVITTILGVLGGGALGAVAGGFISPFAGTIGAVKGGSRASSRIREEKGAATMLDAQLQAYQAQAYAAQPQPTTIYAPSAANNNQFPAQGSPLNAASPQVHGSSVENLGTINGMQLQRA